MGLRIGGLTFGGLASGLPTQDLIEQLLTLERRPIDLLGTQREQLNGRLAIFNDLDQKTRALRDRLRGLDNLALLGGTPSANEEFSRFTATSTNDDVVTATASGTASSASLRVRVTDLAAAERQVSQGFATLDTTVGTGTFSIRVGAGPTTNVIIDGTNNTVSGFVQAINEADAGVTASILNDGSGTPFRVVIQSDTTGAANELTLGNGLSGGTTPAFLITQEAANASILIDPDGANPITVESATNTFSDILTGVTLRVERESAVNTSELIEVEADVDAVVDSISGLVSSFNAVIDVIQGQFDVDPTTNRGGLLIGDSTLSSLKQRLTTVLASQIGNGSIISAAQIGLRLNGEAQLTLDEDVLRDRLESDFQGVRSFFTGANGLANQLRGVTDAFSDSVNGALVARIEGTSRTVQDITEQITDAEGRLGTIEENLVRQFAALERIVSQIRVQGNFLAQFVAQQQR